MHQCSSEDETELGQEQKCQECYNAMLIYQCKLKEKFCNLGVEFFCCSGTCGTSGVTVLGCKDQLNCELINRCDRKVTLECLGIRYSILTFFYL